MTTDLPNNDEEKPPQRDLIYWHLKKSPITQPEAQDLYGVMRLGARILELKEAGFSIRRRFVKYEGKRIAEYFLA